MKGLLLAVLSVLFSVAAYGGPLDPKQVSADAKWMVHADLDLLRGSEMGKFLLAELDKDEPKRKLDAFQAIFNLDPRKDVSGVTIYGLGNKEEDNVALFKGKFDGQRLVTLVKANEGYQETSYSGHAIHSWQEKKGGKDVRNYATLLADGTAVFGGKAALEAALDVVDGRRPNIVSTETFKDLPLTAGRACFLVAGANLADMKNSDPNAAILKEASAGQLTVSENEGKVAVRLALTARTAESAEQMEAVARGLVALGVLQQAKKPALAEMARRTTIRLDGKTVTAVFSCPAADLVTLIREQQAVKIKVSEDAGTEK